MARIECSWEEYGNGADCWNINGFNSSWLNLNYADQAGISRYIVGQSQNQPVITPTIPTTPLIPATVPPVINNTPTITPTTNEFNLFDFLKDNPVYIAVGAGIGLLILILLLKK